MRTEKAMFAFSSVGWRHSRRRRPAMVQNRRPRMRGSRRYHRRTWYRRVIGAGKFAGQHNPLNFPITTVLGMRAAVAQTMPKRQPLPSRENTFEVSRGHAPPNTCRDRNDSAARPAIYIDAQYHRLVRRSGKRPPDNRLRIGRHNPTPCCCAVGSPQQRSEGAGVPQRRDDAQRLQRRAYRRRNRMCESHGRVSRNLSCRRARPGNRMPRFALPTTAAAQRPKAQQARKIAWYHRNIR